MKGFNFERTFNKILYEVDSSHIPQFSVSFIAHFANWYKNRLLPLLRKFFLIPNIQVCGLQKLMFHLLLGSVLLEFNHYLDIYNGSTSQQQFQPQDWDQILRFSHISVCLTSLAL
jgi:hypothetical protein